MLAAPLAGDDNMAAVHGHGHKIDPVRAKVVAYARQDVLSGLLWRIRHDDGVQAVINKAVNALLVFQLVSARRDRHAHRGSRLVQIRIQHLMAGLGLGSCVVDDLVVRGIVPGRADFLAMGKKRSVVRANQAVTKNSAHKANRMLGVGTCQRLAHKVNDLVQLLAQLDAGKNSGQEKGKSALAQITHNALCPGKERTHYGDKPLVSAAQGVTAVLAGIKLQHDKSLEIIEGLRGRGRSTLHGNGGQGASGFPVVEARFRGCATAWQGTFPFVAHVRILDEEKGVHVLGFRQGREQDCIGAPADIAAAVHAPELSRDPESAGGESLKQKLAAEFLRKDTRFLRKEK